MSRPLPSPATGLPRCSNHHAWIGTGACVDCFPIPRGLPQTLGGSASALSFSRPAQASLALRPARLLNRPRRPLSRGFDGTSYPATPPVSYQLNRQLAGWNPPTGVSRLRGAPEIADIRSCRIVTSMTISERLLYPSDRLSESRQRKECQRRRPVLEQADPYLEGQYCCPKRRLTRGETRPRTPNWRK